MGTGCVTGCSETSWREAVRWVRRKARHGHRAAGGDWGAPGRAKRVITDAEEFHKDLQQEENQKAEVDNIQEKVDGRKGIGFAGRGDPSAVGGLTAAADDPRNLRERGEQRLRSSAHAYA